jgi:serine/threonine kinase 32
LIQDKKTKKQYALKYINKAQCIKEDSTMLIFRERMMLQEFQHPFIVGLKYAFQDDENLFIGLELARGGDLRFTMNKRIQFDDFTLQVYMAELADAINYMHSLQYIHRDLKPENILLDDNGHVCVTDLNLATSLKKRKPTSRSGTLDYMGTFY